MITKYKNNETLRDVIEELSNQGFTKASVMYERDNVEAYIGGVDFATLLQWDLIDDQVNFVRTRDDGRKVIVLK